MVRGGGGGGDKKLARLGNLKHIILGITVTGPETPKTWVKVQNFQNPELLKLQPLNLQYVH